MNLAKERQQLERADEIAALMLAHHARDETLAR